MLLGGLLALAALLAACGDQGQGVGSPPPPSSACPPRPLEVEGVGRPHRLRGRRLCRDLYLGQTISQGTVRGSWVIALYYDPSQDAFDQERSKGVQIGQDGRQAPFSVSGLAAGQYVLVGFKDMDRDGQVSPPDYLGIYTDSQGNVLITPGQSGLSLVMELVSAYGYGYQNTLVGLPSWAVDVLRVLAGR